MANYNALPAGTRIGDFVLDRVLGEGGFGITYLAHDVTLQIAVAIKEYLPAEFAVRHRNHSVIPRSDKDANNYTWGLARFLEEARTVALFEHDNIVRVRQYLEAHDTAYIVMRYEEGADLGNLLEGQPALTESELGRIVLPILSGLELVHSANVLHRDIKPSNIYIRRNGTPLLIDFGAARQMLGERSRMTSVLTPHYAPIEQHGQAGSQGPWTDIYALGAVMYQALSKTLPTDAIDRVQGHELVPLSSLVEGRCGHAMLRAIDAALQLKAKDRPQNVVEWRAMMAPRPLPTNLEMESPEHPINRVPPTRIPEPPEATAAPVSHPPSPQGPREAAPAPVPGLPRRVRRAMLGALLGYALLSFPLSREFRDYSSDLRNFFGDHVGSVYAILWYGLRILGGYLAAAVAISGELFGVILLAGVETLVFGFSSRRLDPNVEPGAGFQNVLIALVPALTILGGGALHQLRARRRGAGLGTEALARTLIGTAITLIVAFVTLAFRTLPSTRFSVVYAPNRGQPTSVVYAAGYIWVSTADSASVAGLDPADMHVRRWVNTDTEPLSLRANGSDIWAVVRSKRWLKLSERSPDWIEPRDNSVEQITLDASNPPAVSSAYIFDPGVLGAQDLAFEGGNIWVIGSSERNTLTKLRSSDGTLLASMALGGHANAIEVACGSVWASLSGTNQVRKFDVASGKPLASYPIDAKPERLAFDGTSIWVASAGNGSLTAIRARDGQLVRTVQNAYASDGAIGFDGRYIWTTTSNAIIAIDPGDGSEAHVFPVGDRIQKLAFSSDSVLAISDTKLWRWVHGHYADSYSGACNHAW